MFDPIFHNLCINHISITNYGAASSNEEERKLMEKISMLKLTVEIMKSKVADKEAYVEKLQLQSKQLFDKCSCGVPIACLSDVLFQEQNEEKSTVFKKVRNVDYQAVTRMKNYDDRKVKVLICRACGKEVGFQLEEPSSRDPSSWSQGMNFLFEM